MQMVAVKRVKYPHGPTGREYAPGEGFAALSERDAKGLFIAGKAKYAPAKPAPEKKPVYETRSVTAEPAPAPLDEPPRQRRGYRRRDLTAEG